MESNKVSTKLQKEKIELAVYPAGRKPITLLNQDEFSELYDLYGGNTEMISYWDICNQFIHSSIFSPFISTDQSLVGIYMASDWAKKKKLYYITLIQILKILRTVGNNYPWELEMKYDKKKKDYIFRPS